MENLSFEELLEINCFAKNPKDQMKAAELLEKNYCCEIHCPEIDRSVLFAHHARGCTIVAAKLSRGVVIYQNVTMGSNLKYNRTKEEWENVGSPILDENVIVCDGAKILGPVIIGKNSVIAAGAIITRDIPENSIAFGVNQFKPKDSEYDFVYNSNMISGEEILKTDRKRVEEFKKNKL